MDRLSELMLKREALWGDINLLNSQMKIMDTSSEEWLQTVSQITELRASIIFIQKEIIGLHMEKAGLQ